jgi:hypothetical protein
MEKSRMASEPVLMIFCGSGMSSMGEDRIHLLTAPVGVIQRFSASRSAGLNKLVRLTVANVSGLSNICRQGQVTISSFLVNSGLTGKYYTSLKKFGTDKHTSLF